MACDSLKNQWEEMASSSLWEKKKIDKLLIFLW